MNSASKCMTVLALLLPTCLSLSPLPSSALTPSPNKRHGKRGITSHYFSLGPQNEPLQKKPLRQRSLLEPISPTPQTLLSPLPVANIPKRPKIVLFGATGRIGRRILLALLQSNVDVDVVAFVRNHDKWIRLWHRHDFSEATLSRNDDNKGPKLRVVLGDLTWDLPRHPEANRTEATDESELHRRALSEAISGCTAVVSCVGSYRPTNFWTDYLRVPLLRILRGDVSRWCRDRNHPYYVHYVANRRILGEVEGEMRRREAGMEWERERARLEERMEEARGKREESRIADEFRRKRMNLGKVDSYYNSVLFVDLMAENNATMPLKSAALTDRIKFIRISDVSVGRNPWRLGTVLANVFGSVMFRYENMAEQMLKQSDLVDTIVLRVGDVTTEERHTNNTSLQLNINGVVPTPSIVGQDDVAELAVITALTQIHDPKYSDVYQQHANSSNDSETILPPPKHFTWAVRWAGQHLNPPQGLRPDGSSSAAMCFVKAMQAEMVRARQRKIEKMNRDKMKLYHGGRQLIRLRKWLKAPWRVKPYALSSAMAVYFFLIAMSWMLIGPQLVEVAKRLNRLNIPHVVTKMLS